MTKRKRTSHIPQGAPRKRRPVRRAFDSTTAGPEDSEVESGSGVTFADPPPFGSTPSGATGPVETRAHWVQSQPARTRGRRVEQLRRSGGSSAEFTAAHVSSAPLPVYERSFLMAEIRTVGIITTALLGVIIALTLILR